MRFVGVGVILVFVVCLGILFGHSVLPGLLEAKPDQAGVALVKIPIAKEGFESPTHLAQPPGDPDHLVITERAGRVRVASAGVLRAEPLVDISPRVSTYFERGLFSIAFHPDFDSKNSPGRGRFYLYYTNKTGDIEIDEFKASRSTLIADPDSRRQLLTIPHRQAPNHNGGQLAFDPSGLLLIGTGDGGGAGDDPENDAQSRRSLLGKILRIDPLEHRGRPYSIPNGNPFTDRGGLPEIFLLGLRNPYRFSIDKETKSIFIGDVGEDSREEINRVPMTSKSAGTNLGWRCREGRIENPSYPGCSRSLGKVRDPIKDYPQTRGCSVTGGFVSHSPELPELSGRYIYADFCKPDLRIIHRDGSGERIEDLELNQPVSFGTDNRGCLYLVELGGQVSRLTENLGRDQSCQKKR